MQFKIDKNISQNQESKSIEQSNLLGRNLLGEPLKEQAFVEIANFFALSLEQKKLLEDYVSRLLEENTKFNFIGKSTIDDIWHRHILDSAQLIKKRGHPAPFLLPSH